MTVVGVAHDIKAVSMAGRDEPAIYLPYLQRQISWLGFGSLVVRTEGDPGAFVPELKRAIWAVDGLLAPAGIEPLAERRTGSVSRERFLAVVLSLFAASAILLVIQGLSSIVAFAVAERWREIGVRVALGAARHVVVGLVTREAIAPMALGILAGTGLTLAGSQLLRQALFQVSPTDPMVLGLTVIALVAVTLLASALPAWRATRIDPLEAMKAE
jgi:putative ABC transport system permease protein